MAGMQHNADHANGGLHDDLLMEDLVMQAVEVEQFERATMPASQNLGQIIGHSFQPGHLLRLAGTSQTTTARPASRNLAWRFGSLAAAAAIAIATFLSLRAPAPQSAVPAPGKSDRAGLVFVPPSNPETRRESDHVVRLVSTPDKLEPYAYLDPDLVDGLPTLSGERSLLVAVYRGMESGTSGCDCLTWSVQDASNMQAKPDMLADAVHSPCGAASRGVTLVSITGPRTMLPFHDDDARELVQCLADVANDDADNDPCVVDDLCQATLAALCLPAELSVRTLSVRVGE